MKRRNAVKAIALSTITPHILFGESQSSGGKITPTSLSQSHSFQSSWHRWPNMPWIGPGYWGNRLQDWEIRDGKATCVVSDENRSLHSLIHQLSDQSKEFESLVTVEWLGPKDPMADSYVGFRIGTKGRFEDYRSAAVFGEGLDAGLRADGQLFIGDNRSAAKVNVQDTLRLKLEGKPNSNQYTLRLSVYDLEKDEPLAELTVDQVAQEKTSGGIALVSHIADGQKDAAQPSAAFSDWGLKGGKILQYSDRTFGPICFAQYTLHDKALKLNAQLTPVETVAGYKISLQVKTDGDWETLRDGSIHPMGRVAHFRVEDWDHKKAVPYRVRLELPLKDGIKEYFYEGTIAEEPIDTAKVKMAVFSCNADYGFPDGEVSLNSLKHQPDLAVFLGDQFYESTGGFGIQTSPLDKATLDYLRKWYMFGWSYREIFRHIPSAFIPDDHDVYHGNVWGEGGKHAPSDEGWGYVAQDQGGYKMPAEWVNMVQDTQTGHLPDPYDPTPVKQGIGTYYTDWVYGGISFAILEDRKFKSAPKNVLPEEAKVTNGFVQNRQFDIKQHYDIEADLLGDRQLAFLAHWAADWDRGAQMKAVLSQTNFCTVATLPEGSIIDSIVPKLPIPELGEYVSGDAPTTDMDSNGWPQKGRDEALKIIRKSFALHIAGDQHLASVVHYGVDEFGDSGFAFAGPALNNLFPRRWWPTVGENHQPLPGQAKNTGNFQDGFGNKMTVHAVANPHQTGRKPARIYDRATGYGIVTFDKQEGTMKLECWPRYVDPEKEPNGQYGGWPITLSQDDNYSRKAAGYLPLLQIKGDGNPVVQLINEESGQLEYNLRVKGKNFRPKVFSPGKYTVKLFVPETGKEHSLTGLEIAKNDEESLEVSLALPSALADG